MKWITTLTMKYHEGAPSSVRWKTLPMDRIAKFGSVSYVSADITFIRAFDSEAEAEEWAGNKALDLIEADDLDQFGSSILTEDEDLKGYT